MMNDIQIFMCCHKAFEFLPPMCQPIQCGAALSQPVKGAVSDNTGDSISAKNREYCELTAHYYAWKNVKADHYGFCHYRRFFCADDSVKYPYLAWGMRPDIPVGDENHWRHAVSEYDIVVPRSEDMGLSAREHYCTSLYHYPEDLELFLKILSGHSPQIMPTAERYLSQRRQYFCNMFIMNREDFFEYCGILFPVLEEFDSCKTLHGDFQSDRVDGYLGEIFTGIFITLCRERGEKIKEVPRLDVCCSAKKRLSYHLLPPESRRRFLVKKLAKKFRG